MGRDPTAETDRLRIPFEAIQVVLRTANLTRTQYVWATRSIRAWCRGQQIDVYPLFRDPTLGADVMDFVDYQMTPEELATCKDWTDPNTVEFHALLDGIIKDGYRISFTYDKKNRCVVSTLIGKTDECLNVGKAMSSRHATVARAVQISVYKQVVIFSNGEWGDSDPNTLYG